MMTEIAKNTLEIGTNGDAKLEVSPEEFNMIREWSMLHESEYLTRIWQRWPVLRELMPGTVVKLKVVYR